MANRHGERWTAEELAAAVDAYLEMFHLQNRGSDFTKSDVVRALLRGPLAERTRKSVEFRFCNISSVLREHSHNYLDGYAPLDHVGKGSKELIMGLLLDRGFDL